MMSFRDDRPSGCSISIIRTTSDFISAFLGLTQHNPKHLGCDLLAPSSLIRDASRRRALSKPHSIVNNSSSTSAHPTLDGSFHRSSAVLQRGRSARMNLPVNPPILPMLAKRVDEIP